MAPVTRKWSLMRAAIGGAMIGAAILLMNVFLQGQFAANGITAVLMMMLGAAIGGAVLFLFIAIVANMLVR
jgi:hypothetical protein